MARSFNGSTQYLQAGFPTVTATPCTFAAWFRPGTVSGALAICFSGGSDSNKHELGIIQVNAAFWALAQAGGTNAQAVSSATLVANVWHHGCGVFRSPTDRSAYVNGGSRGNNATSREPVPSAMIRTRIAQRAGSDDQKYNGDIAEVAIWQAALSDDAIKWLAAGFTPLSPQMAAYRPYLLGYWPLNVRGEDGWFSRHKMTLVGSPAVSVHPRVFPARVSRFAVTVGGVPEVSTATLTWTDAPAGGQTIHIERSATSAYAGFSEIDTVAAATQTYEDAGLAAGTYWYRVRGHDGTHYTDYSNVATVTVS